MKPPPPHSAWQAKYKGADDGEEETEVQKEIELKPAEVVTNLSLDWMRNCRVDQTLAHLAGDSTASYEGWVIAWFGRKIERKMHWLICKLHTNEMMRTLIEKLDGETDSKIGFSDKRLR